MPKQEEFYIYSHSSVTRYNSSLITANSSLRIRCVSIGTAGYVYCDQVRSVDLNQRRLTKIDSFSYDALMDIADTVWSIFDYVNLRGEKNAFC